MIDWQLKVDGAFPPGWNEHSDGCWFPDFDTQQFLLPYFDVGDQPIDEWGSTVFDAASIVRLQRHLQWRRSFIEGKPAVWTITETVENRAEALTICRDEVLRVIDKTIAMASLATSLDAELLFRGD
jgi:hypothetical protein